MATKTDTTAAQGAPYSGHPEQQDQTHHQQQSDTHSRSASSDDLPYNKRDAGFVYRKTWKGKIWDTLDLPPFERRMLLKVDSVLLTLMAVSTLLTFPSFSHL